METYKKIVRDLFDKVSQGYDNSNLRFFKSSAISMLDFLNLKGHEYLLDVAAGTGNVTIEAAKRLTNGKVHAVDLSPKMLDIIKTKAHSNQLKNITSEEVDMQVLSHGQVFDVATCAFGIFFLAEMDKGLEKIKLNIKPEGSFVLTTFHESFLQPLSDKFYNRLEVFGIPKNPSSWLNINTEDKTREILISAGFKNIEIKQVQHGYYLKNTNDWWDVIWNAGMRRAFEMLPEEKHEKFLKEHFEEVNELKTEKGIWMDVPVIFARGIA